MCLARHSNKLSTNCAGRLGSPMSLSLWWRCGSQNRRAQKGNKRGSGGCVGRRKGGEVATDSSSNLTSFNVSGLHGPWDATSNRRRPSCSGLPSHSRQLGKTTGPVARTFGGGCGEKTATCKTREESQLTWWTRCHAERHGISPRSTAVVLVLPPPHPSRLLDLAHAVDLAGDWLWSGIDTSCASHGRMYFRMDLDPSFSKCHFPKAVRCVPSILNSFPVSV